MSDLPDVVETAAGAGTGFRRAFVCLAPSEDAEICAMYILKQLLSELEPKARVRVLTFFLAREES
jgi:hypothetical protein